MFKWLRRLLESPKDIEICEKYYGKHEKGDTMMFAYRINIITGGIEALYHCKKCQTVLHYSLSKNQKEKELHDIRSKQTENFKNLIKLK